jgi:MFS family permease
VSRGAKAAAVAWLITAVYYFYQYTLRSAPAVMMPQLSEAFGLTSMGVASMVGLFYWGYSPFSLVAGAALDRLGPRKVVPLGAAAVGIGALLFASGSSELASVGRLLQGAGGVFALVGAVYIATNTGVVNFLNFTFSALLGPVFGWLLRREAGGDGSLRLVHYQDAFEPMLYGVGLALILCFVLKETGPAAHAAPSTR